MRERWFPDGGHSFSIEHVVPQSIDRSQDREYGNLIYACHLCNSLRQDREVLDPTAVALGQHIQIDQDGTVHGLMPSGIALIAVLDLDDPEITEFRQRIIQNVLELEQNGTEIAVELVRRWLGFPADLPNLISLRPPAGNTRPSGTESCYYERRKRGDLPDRY